MKITRLESQLLPARQVKEYDSEDDGDKSFERCKTLIAYRGAYS